MNKEQKYRVLAFLNRVTHWQEERGGDDLHSMKQLLTKELKRVEDEPVARLMHWCGPKPIPHQGIAARTFAEYPADTHIHDRYWLEGEPLYTHPQSCECPKDAEPFAWIRDDGTMRNCMSNDEKNSWLKHHPRHVENYTIPVYDSTQVKD